jgi:hypothetical protein
MMVTKVTYGFRNWFVLSIHDLKVVAIHEFLHNLSSKRKWTKRKGRRNRNPHPLLEQALLHAISICGILIVADEIEIANRFLWPTHTASDFALPRS